MSTAFPHCGSDSSACRRKEITRLPASGGSGGGPQALRPARLQWLSNITTGSQIAAHRQKHRKISESRKAKGPKCEMASGLTANTIQIHAYAGLKPWAGIPLHFFFMPKAGQS